MTTRLASVIEFPIPSQGTMMLIAAALIGLIGVAVAIELHRQKRQRRRRIAHAWRQAEAIAEDKELSEAEWDLMRRIIKRWAPDDPLHVMSNRQHFDRCVEAEMTRLAESKDRAQFDEMGLVLRDARIHLALDYIPIGQRIHSTRELYRSQEVWLNRAEAKPPRWSRGVVAWVDEGHFSVSPAPQSGTRPPELAKGSPVQLRMWREEDARYAFTATLYGREDEPPAWVFDHTSDLKRFQSRAYCRVRHDQPTMAGVLDAPREEVESLDRDAEENPILKSLSRRRVVTRLRGRILNISAGGLALVINQPIPRLVVLRITLELADVEPFDAHLRPVSITPVSGGRHLVRGAFIGIDGEDREKVAHYVARRQQALSQAEPEQAV